MAAILLFALLAFCYYGLTLQCYLQMHLFYLLICFITVLKNQQTFLRFILQKKIKSLSIKQYCKAILTICEKTVDYIRKNNFLKMKTIKPLLFAGLFFVIITTSCNKSSSTTN